MRAEIVQVVKHSPGRFTVRDAVPRARPHRCAGRDRAVPGRQRSPAPVRRRARPPSSSLATTTKVRDYLIAVVTDAQAKDGRDKEGKEGKEPRGELTRAQVQAIVDPDKLVDAAAPYLELERDDLTHAPDRDRHDEAPRADHPVARAPGDRAPPQGRHRRRARGRVEPHPPRARAARPHAPDPGRARRAGRQRRDRRAAQEDRRQQDERRGARGRQEAAVAHEPDGVVARPSTTSRARTSRTCSRSRGTCSPTTGSTCRRRARSSRPSTPASRRSSAASSSSSRCASSRRTSTARSCCSSARPASARPRSASRSRASLGRKYVRISLGGVRDEAEVRGHRRTYIGALPGRIVAGLKKAGSMNPVFVLDEIDKLAADMRGDPAAAMLEVLDPEQNKDFVDHYVEVPVDLSKVMFICTANQLDTISQPLLDRMEMVELSGYTSVEKLAIAKNHLLPKQLGEHGISKEQLDIDDDALAEIIHSYTREAGVRNLEREIAAVCRGAAVKVAEGATSVHMTPRRARGAARSAAPRLRHRRAQAGGRRDHRPRVDAGRRRHHVHRVRASIPGKGEVRLTGQMGDVMKESAQAAVSWMRANAVALGIDHDKIANSRPPHPPAAGRDQEGRPVGRRRADLRGRLGVHQPARPQRRRDHRRDRPPRQRAADRRRQGEGARRPPRGHQDRVPPGAQRRRTRSTSPTRSRPSSTSAT